MTIEKKLEGNKLTLVVSGRLDTSTYEQLEKELTSLDGIKDLVFDFENLEYISSAGLRVVLATFKRIKGSFKIIHTNETVKEVFDLTGFSQLLKVE